MAEHLWPLLRLNADTDEELKEAYRKVFIETYVRSADGRPVEIYDWLGNRIYFKPGVFDHAFSESSDYRFSYGVHDIPFSKRRARCIMWIKEVLAGSSGTIERRHQSRKDSRERWRKRRNLIVVEEKYVVVLDELPNHKEFEFVTAFPADSSYLERIRRDSVLVETKKEKPQS